MKICSRCKNNLPESEFVKSKRNKDGLSSYCRDCKCKISKESYARNIDYYEKRNKKYAKELRDEILAHYGGKCVCCGETRPEFLAIDHINNDGGKQRKIAGGGGFTFQVWVKKNNYPDDLQILCHNCNLAKGFYGYCPHEFERSAK